MGEPRGRECLVADELGRAPDAGAPPNPGPRRTEESAYIDPWDHLKDELQRLAIRLGLAIRKMRARPAEGPLDAFRGLVISDEEVVGVVEELADADAFRKGDPDGSLHDSLTALDTRIDARLRASARQGTLLPLPRLRQLLGLTAFEEQCLVMCVAPELDRRYERLYAYLQDDATRRRPSIGLALDVFFSTTERALAARTSFDPLAPLARYRLCRIHDSNPESPPSPEHSMPAGPLLARALSFDERMVGFLLGWSRLDARLDDLVLAPRRDDPVVVDAAAEARIRELVGALRRGAGAQPSIVFHLFGKNASEGRGIAEAVCLRLGVTLLVADLERMLAGPIPFGDAIGVLAREAVLLPSALCLENLDALLAEPAKNAGALRSLVREIGAARGLAFLLGSRAWFPGELGDALEFFGVNVSPDTASAARSIWEDHGARSERVGKDVDFGSLASRFRFGSTEIRNVFTIAGNLARWRSPERDTEITMGDLNDACRRVGTTRLSTLARRLPSRKRWAELILPPGPKTLLEELCNEARQRHRVLGDWGFGGKLSYGRGLTALFSGPPGTGKTMAAQAIAAELELELYRIDLSQVVSKYIGETEKNLAHVFDDAEATHAVLLFDEADALFGKRSEVKDAHDRYANIEVGFLLQRMEEFEGIAILATNLRQNLDDAFVRRLRFIVEFPFPDEEQRRRIWEVTFPPEAPLGPDVDFAGLARDVRLAGGHIRNIGLAAAFHAASAGSAIEMAHLLNAAVREHEKLGRTWAPAAREAISSRKDAASPRNEES